MPAELQSQKRRDNKVQPLWGWSGGSIVRVPRDRTNWVRSIVERMPIRASGVDEIVEAVLQLGGRYHRYLHQDEFGPTRAQCLAALRQVDEQLVRLIEIIDELPQHLQDRISEALANDAVAPFPAGRLYYFIDKAAVGRIARAAISIVDGEQIETLSKLAHQAKLTHHMLAHLDTTTQFDIALTGPARIKKRWSSRRVGQSLVDADASLRRLRQCIAEALGHLERKRGAEPSPSICLLVSSLCELWRRETGARVTGDCIGYRRHAISKSGKFHKGRATTPAGQFIIDIIEALRPTEVESGPGYRPARTKKLLLPNSCVRASAIHYAIRAHIANVPKETRRGRPRKAVQ